jgi:hypothetical protein
MMGDISDVLAKLGQAKGLRNALWFLLISSIAIFVFESLTQYFATSNLQARIDIVTSLSKITSTEMNAQKIASMHGELIQEAITLNQYHYSPASFVLEGIVRFIKGAYISLPLFYLLFKLIVTVSKHIKDESHKVLAIWFSSIALSFATWLATVLGIVSVILNTSSSIWMSWFVFPFASLFLMIPFVLWLVVLRISMPSTKSDDSKNSSSVEAIGKQE